MNRIPSPSSVSSLRRARVGMRGLCLGVAAAVVLPWVAAWWLVPDKRIDWDCHAHIEFDTRTSAGEHVQVFGLMESQYHKDGSGNARFSGRVQQDGKSTVVHRASEFKYAALDRWVRVNTVHTSRLRDDNSPDDLVYRFVYPGFQPDHTDYFEVMRVGDGASVGFNGQPRAYCAPVAPHAVSS
ncbi:hypothetical protein PPN31114_04406 [Pandoraea pneumonica]|uniref:Uncharacterized protein n=1 Tax=Pandoraea pneumonica TaxID=2508299 RepID=A0A5E4YBF6_9BURK|nr:hypothetical protein [Pandoraea pneumonica]VVE45810.1 hypothetical protein PPN31114_04406 [Pandoraea pneumonica]